MCDDGDSSRLSHLTMQRQNNSNESEIIYANYFMCESVAHTCFAFCIINFILFEFIRCDYSTHVMHKNLLQNFMNNNNFLIFYGYQCSKTPSFLSNLSVTVDAFFFYYIVLRIFLLKLNQNVRYTNGKEVFSKLWNNWLFLR